jgi:isopentenyl diphosphate isomerase/L-lactate dehydrogenase-like FMN-dependent dehydrogenase
VAGVTGAPAGPAEWDPPPRRAGRAVDYESRAILVSNHGGRQLKSSAAALDALPAVVAAEAGCGGVCHGGMRRGTDVLTALALGAQVVLIGRLILESLAVGGEARVRHVLELLRDDLAFILMLCDLASRSDVERSLLVPAGAEVNE